MIGGIFMNKWKKNLLAASVLLVVCAGIYMNWMYSSAEDVADLTDKLDSETVMSPDGIILDTNGDNVNMDTSMDYFAAVRLSRQEARDSAVNLLQEAMAYTTGEDAAKDAESAVELEQIVQTALSEAQIESLIIAKGYTDCVAYMSGEGISVAVASPEGGLQQQDVAVIADIVMAQSDYGLDAIRVVEVQ
jgi:stage III sporulation protein AH